MSHLELIKLTALMERTRGNPSVKIGLVDGPVATRIEGLASGQIHELAGCSGASCTNVDSLSCLHGTFVAGILAGKRGSRAPAICPDCTLLVRPIFAEAASGSDQMPSATPRELATAMIECIEAGARVINLSLALAQPSVKGEQALGEALNLAVRRGIVVVAAAGNQSTLGSSAITRHPWVIPVVACDLQGRPMKEANLGHSIGRLGLTAPGDRVTSLGTASQPVTLGGTSFAAPFVTGAIALLWSEFPTASAAQVKLAVTQAHKPRRTTMVPPLLDAWAAYQVMRS